MPIDESMNVDPMVFHIIEDMQAQVQRDEKGRLTPIMESTSAVSESGLSNNAPWQLRQDDGEEVPYDPRQGVLNISDSDGGVYSFNNPYTTITQEDIEKLLSSVMTKPLSIRYDSTLSNNMTISADGTISLNPTAISNIEGGLCDTIVDLLNRSDINEYPIFKDNNVEIKSAYHLDCSNKFGFKFNAGIFNEKLNHYLWFPVDVTVELEVLLEYVPELSTMSSSDYLDTFNEDLILNAICTEYCISYIDNLYKYNPNFS